LNDLDVNEVRRVEFGLITEQAGLDSRAKLSLQEKLQFRHVINMLACASQVNFQEMSMAAG
jgi:hypothetical protein